MSLRTAIALTMLSLAGAAQAQTAFFFEANTSYLSAADIPAGFYQDGPDFLDNLEDDVLNGNVLGTVGGVIGAEDFGGLVDSVQADSAGIGRSWFSINGDGGVTFNFTGSILPTAFALVVTDSTGTVTFEALDVNDLSLGSIARTGFQDGAFNGGTAEDRFFGAASANGIKSIKVSAPGGGLEVDHIQYGVAAVPEPTGAIPWLAVVGAIGASARRRAALRSAKRPTGAPYDRRRE